MHCSEVRCSWGAFEGLPGRDALRWQLAHTQDHRQSPANPDRRPHCSYAASKAGFASVAASFPVRGL